MNAKRLSQALAGLLSKTNLTSDEVQERLAQATSRAYWQRLNPGLSIELRKSPREIERTSLDPSERSELVEHFAEAGYFSSRPIISTSFLKRLVASVRNLRRQGWPEVFAFIYDEFWLVPRIPSVRKLLTATLGAGYKQNRFLWCYYISPHPGSHGWMPHADGLNMEGRLQIWIPLTDATLDNGCVYVIPNNRVPHDLVEDLLGHQHLNAWNVSVLLQNCKALPARAGSILSWEFGVVHWGSVVGKTAHPRISIAMEFQSARAKIRPSEQPLFDSTGPLPSFEERLFIVGSSLGEYTKFEPSIQRFARLGEGLVNRRA